MQGRSQGFESPSLHVVLRLHPYSWKAQVNRLRRVVGPSAVAFVLLTIPVIVPTPSDAASSVGTVAYEGFDYTDGGGADLLDGVAGGTGWSSNWDWTYSAGSSMQVGSPGLSYSGLTTTGNKAAFYQRIGGNQISQILRTLPLQDSGVVYFQVLTSSINNPGSSSGGGTPTLRFSANGTPTFSLGGNGVGTATVMALLDSSGRTQLIASTELLSSPSLLTIVRVDHDAGITSMWTNPDMSTFDYTNPPATNLTVSQTFDFDQVAIYLRQGSVDELKVLTVDEVPEDPSQRPPDWFQQYARALEEECREEWSPSWATWPNEGSGGFVCTRILTWSHETQGFVVAR